MKKLFNWGVLAMVVSSLLFVGCKKDKEKADVDLVSAEDQSQGEMVYDQVFKQVDLAANDQGLKKGGYPIIMIDTNSSPRNMVIDYGIVNYLCTDGNYRRGIIMVSWTGKYREQNTVISISFNNFYQNNNQVEGLKNLTNMGRNENGKLKFSITVSGKITNTDGQTHQWNSNRTRIWLEGEATPLVSDDIYEISGNTSGVNRNGLIYTALITSNLLVDLGCEYRITRGIIELTPEGKAKRTIDFGSGNCDKLINVTINGKTTTIERRK